MGNCQHFPEQGYNWGEGFLDSVHTGTPGRRLNHLVYCQPEAIIKENRERLDGLADALLNEETLEMSAVEGILGERAKKER
jgi:hypothetical protein